MIKDLFTSKTGLGLILGILGIIIGTAEIFPESPAFVGDVIAIIGFALSAFGLKDAMEQEQAELLEKIKAFVMSEPFAGVAIVAINEIINNVDQFGFPDPLPLVLNILGSTLVVLGLRKAGAKARLNMAPPAKMKKYEKFS